MKDGVIRRVVRAPLSGSVPRLSNNEAMCGRRPENDCQNGYVKTGIMEN